MNISKAAVIIVYTQKLFEMKAIVVSRNQRFLLRLNSMCRPMSVAWLRANVKMIVASTRMTSSARICSGIGVLFKI